MDEKLFKPHCSRDIDCGGNDNGANIEEVMKIVVIGAGNLATNLASQIVLQTPHTIEQIYSRTTESARLLGEKIQVPYTTSFSEIREDADLYLFSIKDSALKSVLPKMPQNARNALWAHTSGSLDVDIFKDYVVHYGVLYPLQTFSKERLVELKDVPLLLEGSTKNAVEKLTTIASSLSSKTYELDSEKRRYFHLAGVIACNFTNHLYHISKNILDKQGLSFELLLPLIEETTNKIKVLSPQQAQTGPAIRYDLNIIDKHLALLEDENLKEMYKLMSESIHRLNNKEQQ